MRKIDSFNLAKKLSTVRKILSKRRLHKARIAPKMLIVAVGALLFTVGYRNTNTTASVPQDTYARELRSPATLSIQEVTSADQEQLRSTITHANALATLFEDPTTLAKQQLDTIEIWMNDSPAILSGRPTILWWTVMATKVFQGVETLVHPSVTIVDTSFHSMGRAGVVTHGPDIGIATVFPLAGSIWQLFL